MEENLESHVGSEDVCKLENINVNAKEPQQPGKGDKEKNYLTCDHSATVGESEMDILATIDTE